MEAARNLGALPRQLRSRRFTRECEELRPLGIAYVLRQFGHSLDRADAEDAVAEVIVRLHRRAASGQIPDNLRAAFFTSARNAAIDQLRSRAVRPTVPLEALAESPNLAPAPAELAESSDDVVRLREALARMRPNYREAIVLRYGLDLSVPEIAERLQISLPAAKKLILRSTNQIRERIEAIGGEEFCPEMRDLAQRSIFDREAAGLSGPTETAALQAHFEHCGPCRTFLAALHRNLHELGSGALLGGYGLERSGALHQLSSWAGDLGRPISSGVAKVRLAAYRATGAMQPEGPASTGGLAGAGQKLAAICTAGAATTATCLATGIVGPGLGAASVAPVAVHHPAPAAKVKPAARVTTRPLFYEPSHPPAQPVAAEPAASPSPDPAAAQAKQEPRPQARVETAAAKPAEPREQPAPTPAQQEQEEFGFETEASAPSSVPAAEPPVAAASDVGSESSPTSEAHPSPAPKGSEQFGFGG